jgi:hypothetical protein
MGLEHAHNRPYREESLGGGLINIFTLGHSEKPALPLHGGLNGGNRTRATGRDRNGHTGVYHSIAQREDGKIGSFGHT